MGTPRREEDLRAGGPRPNCRRGGKGNKTRRKNRLSSEMYKYGRFNKFSKEKIAAHAI